MDRYKYKAFISYSHKDIKFARWLQKSIENYKIPKDLKEKYPYIPKNLIRSIFRDEEELPTSSALPDNLSSALESSEFLIVICSPSSVKSKWVNKEISYFKSIRGEDNVLAIIADGEPNATYSKMYDPNDEAFPEALRYEVDKNGKIIKDRRTEPIAADARKFLDRKRALVKLIAGLLKIDFADLWKRDQKERKKRAIISSLFGIFVLGIFSFTLYQHYAISSNKELETINEKIALIEYKLKQPNITKKTIINLSKELKDLENKKKNIEETLKSFGLVKTKITKKAKKIYNKKGAKEALKILNSPLSLKEDRELKETFANKSILRAKLYIETKDFINAKKCYKQAINEVFNYKNVLEYANFLMDQDEPIEAERLYKKLLATKITNEQRAKILNSLGLLYHNQNEMYYAERNYKESLKIKYQLKNKIHNNENIKKIDSEIADTLVNLGNLYKEIARKQEAEKRYKKALEIYDKLIKKKYKNFEADKALVLNNLGTLYFNSDSEKFFKEALRINEKLLQKNKKELSYTERLNIEAEKGNNLNNLGLFYYTNNNFDKAEKYYQAALEIRKDLINKNRDRFLGNLADTLTNMANLYFKQTKLQLSEKKYKEALGIYENVLMKKNNDKYAPKAAAIYTNLALLYPNLNKIKETEQNYISALQIYEKLQTKDWQKFTPYVAKTLMALTDLYISTKLYSKAEQNYKKALKLYKQLSINNPKAYEIELAEVLLFGYLYKMDKTISLEEIKKLLKTHPHSMRAKKLLIQINKITNKG